MNPIKFAGRVLWGIFGEDVVNAPRGTAAPESPQQAYNRLVSQRRRASEEQELLEQLHAALGKRE